MRDGLELAGGVRRALRTPALIVGEVLAVACAAAASTLVEQRPGPLAQSRLAAEHPSIAPLVRAIGLDHVFTTWWFLALVLLAALSLLVVLAEQWRRVLRELRREPGEASFRTAPYRAEFTRAPRGAAGVRVRTRGRAGALGSPVFHLGLLVVLAAGALRATASASAAAEVYEGEVLPAGPEGLGAQWPGVLAAKVALGVPVELVRLSADLYPSGALRGLSADVGIGAGAAARPARIAVNAPLALPGGELYLSQEHGAAVFLEVEGAGTEDRRVHFLEAGAPGEFVKAEQVAGGLRVRMRVDTRPAFERPDRVELRALRGGALAGAALLRPGEALALAGGVRLVVRDVRWWARVEASRDRSAPVAFAGFLLVAAGAALVFVVVRVDALVSVTPEGDRERVVLALRPARFAPLFAARFEALVRAEGGPAISSAP